MAGTASSGWPEAVMGIATWPWIDGLSLEANLDERISKDVLSAEWDRAGDVLVARGYFAKGSKTARRLKSMGAAEAKRVSDRLFGK